MLVVAVITAASAPAAWADGDPASDFLVANQVFLTSQPAAPSASQRQLTALVRGANRAGFRIRVAVVSSEYDLGSITALWRKPSLYARFLGLELSAAYRGRLLVVMPNGFGLNWPDHSTAADARLLAAVALGAAPDDLATGAQAAVRRLATAAGVSLAAPRPIPSASRARPGAGRSGAVPAALFIGAGAAVLVLLAAFALALPRTRAWLRARRRRPRAAAGDRAVPVGARWAIPAGVLVCAAAVVVPILLLRRSAISNASPASVITPPPLSWPAGRRPAPQFVLHDQHGRAVSVAAYRGRPLIVTFVDPLCRNLCPLEAHLLNQVVGEMPVSRRPVILAVSVDVYADARRNLLQDERKWDLVPQWHWAVGSPAELTRVWKRYEVGVRVVTKHIAATTIHYITHTEAAYIIDATGHERAVFVWPFYPQDVERTLQQLS